MKYLDSFSSAHLETAKKLFPKKVKDKSWLNKKWTKEEIKLCKYHELASFNENPLIKNYPSKKNLYSINREEIELLSNIILNSKIP